MDIVVKKHNGGNMRKINSLKNVDSSRLKIVKERTKGGNSDSDSDDGVFSDVQSESDVSEDQSSTSSFKKPSDASYAQLSNPIKTKPMEQIESDSDNESVYSNNKSDVGSRVSDDLHTDSGESDFERSQHRERKKHKVEKVKYETDEDRQKILDEKAEILSKFERLAAKGLKPQKKYTMKSKIEDLRKEYKRLSRTIEIDNSIKFQRRALIAILSGLEFVNKRYDPFDIKLEGWSESVMDNIGDYDNVFEKLFDKYNTSTEVAPEIELIMMLAGSAFMFHMTKSLFKNNVPNMSEIIKENPALMQSIANTMSKQKGESSNTNQFQPPPQANLQRISEDERLSESSFVTDMSDVKNVTVHTTQNSKKQPKKVMNMALN